MCGVFLFGVSAKREEALLRSRNQGLGNETMMNIFYEDVEKIEMNLKLQRPQSKANPNPIGEIFICEDV